MGIRRALFASFVGLPLCGVACFGKSSSGGPITSFLGPEASTFDSAADDGPSAEPPDASAKDAAPEATSPDAASGPVTVKVVAITGAEPGVTVAFQDATGALLTSATTDGSGAASGTVPAGGQVSVLLGSPDLPWILTYVAVSPGDTLNVVDPANRISGTVDVGPLPTPLPVAHDFEAIIGRGSGSAGTPAPTVIPTATSFPTGLNLQLQFPVLVVGVDISGNQTAYAFKTGNALATDGGVTNVSMAGASWSPPGTLSVTAAPASLAADAAVVDPISFDLVEVSGGVTTRFQKDAVIAGGSATAVIPTHPGFGDFVQLETDVVDSQPTYTATLATATRAASFGPSATLGVNLGLLMPELSSPVLDTTTPTRPSLAWTSPAMPGAAGTIAMVSWTETLEGGSRYGSWTLILPPGVTSAKAPVLPASPLAPTAAATWPTGGITIETLQGTGLATYADLRAAAGAAYYSLGGTPCIPPMPMDGTAMATMLAGN